MITKAQALAEYLGHPNDDDVGLASLTDEIGHYEADGALWLVSETDEVEPRLWDFREKRYNYLIYSEIPIDEIEMEDDDV